MCLFVRKVQGHELLRTYTVDSNNEHNHKLPVNAEPVRIPWQLLAVELVEAGEVMGDSGLLVRRRGECGGRLVTVGGGRRGGVVPLRGRGSILAAFHQVGPLWEGWTPLLIRATQTKKCDTARWYSVRDIAGSYVLIRYCWGAWCLTGAFKLPASNEATKRLMLFFQARLLEGLAVGKTAGG